MKLLNVIDDMLYMVNMCGINMMCICDNSLKENKDVLSKNIDWDIHTLMIYRIDK